MAADNDPRGPGGGVTPYLTVKGAGAAVDFYKAAFGAEEQFRNVADDGERLLHAHLKINGASVMLSDDFTGQGGAPSGVTLHLEVDDADRWWDRAIAAGAEATMPLDDQFWGARYGQIRDPFGHRWSIGGPIPR